MVEKDLHPSKLLPTENLGRDAPAVLKCWMTVTTRSVIQVTHLLYVTLPDHVVATEERFTPMARPAFARRTFAGSITSVTFRALPERTNVSPAPSEVAFWPEGVPVNKSLLLLALYLGSLSPAQAGTKPVTCTQLQAWLVAGVSNTRLAQIVEHRGALLNSKEPQPASLRKLGADADLLAALKQSGAVSESNPGCSPEFIGISNLVHAKQYAQAERQIRELVQADGDNAALHFVLGSVLRQQDKWDDAYDEFTESARLIPDLPETHSRLASFFFHADDPENAIAEARTALSLDTRNAEAYKYLGLGLSSNGQFDAALHAFQESLERQPDNPEIYYDMGMTLRDKGDLAGAAAAYRKAIVLKPAYWEAHTNLGLALHDQHKYAEAIAEYKEAKRLAPDEPAVRNNLGSTYCDNGDFDAAIAEFRELFRQHPDWQSGHNCVAKALMAKHDYAGAIAELYLAVGQNPTGAAEHRVLGQALLLTGKNDEAASELRRAVSLNPESAIGHHYLGMALSELKDYAGAVTEYREAVRLEPTASNHYYLAACLIRTGIYDEALAELETAARMDPAQSLYRARKDELLKIMKAPDNR